MRADAWTDPEALADMYLEGRSRKTFPTYNCAFRKLWVHSVEIGKSVFNWNEMDVAGHLVMLDGNEASVNMLKQASAVITLLKEVAGLDTNVRSGFVSQVKKGCMKRAKDREGKRSRRVKTVMRLEHVRLMIKLYYKRPAWKVSPLDRRFLVQQLFLYFGMRRYDDIKEITYGDVKILKEGNLEIYVNKSKTDQEGHGFVFHMTGERMNGFSIPEVVVWYAESLGLRDGDYLFPRLRGAGKGRVAKIGHENVSYSASAAQLKRFCLRNDIPNLTMHSGRRGGVTVAVEMGLPRNKIQAVGNWSSGAVDGYYHPLEPGVEFTKGLLRRL